MSDVQKTLCLFALIICLGTCFIWALYEIEMWRQRRRWHAKLVSDARRSVVTVTQDKSKTME
jgi:hypothetical protein